MPGIIFLKTKQLEKIAEFYKQRLRMQIWIDQGSCIILKKDNIILGFCEGEDISFSGIITFFHKSKEEVDAIYQKNTDIALDKPHKNDKFNIYQFFAEDPEGRKLEFQKFLDTEIDY